MKTRSNRSYDITKTQKRGTESTSQHQRRAVQKFRRDPDYQPFRQLRSAKNRARDTYSSTTIKPTIIKVKKFKRSAPRPRWNYGKLVAVQAEAHRAAFQEAGVTQAPPPTWSYVRALAEKAAARAVHRTAFQEAGVDCAPPPTWSYRRVAAAKKNSRAAHRAAYEESGRDRTPFPTWSYKTAAARKARSALQTARVDELLPLTWCYQRDESLRSTRTSVFETSESSGFASWSSMSWSALSAAAVEVPPPSLSYQRHESATRKSSWEPSETSESSD